MGAIINKIHVGAGTLVVSYSDNGHNDNIVKNFIENSEAVEWLKLWYSDLSGGFIELETAVKKLEE